MKICNGELGSWLRGTTIRPTLMAFQVIPKVDEARIYEVVDRAIEVVAASGLPYIVSPMETTIEGEPDELWEIIKKAQDACIEAGASRVMTHIKNGLCSGWFYN